MKLRETRREGFGVTSFRFGVLGFGFPSSAKASEGGGL